MTFASLTEIELAKFEVKVRNGEGKNILLTKTHITKIFLFLLKTYKKCFV